MFSEQLLYKILLNDWFCLMESQCSDLLEYSFALIYQCRCRNNLLCMKTLNLPLYKYSFTNIVWYAINHAVIERCHLTVFADDA